MTGQRGGGWGGHPETGTPHLASHSSQAEPGTPQSNGPKVISLWPRPFKSLGTLWYLREDQVQPPCGKAEATMEINAQGQPRVSG